MRKKDIVLSRRLLKVALVVVVLGALSGCYRISYSFPHKAGEVQQAEHWNNFFVGGIVKERDAYRLKEFCPGGELVEIETSQKPAAVLASVLSGYLHSAYVTKVECRQLR